MPDELDEFIREEAAKSPEFAVAYETAEWKARALLTEAEVERLRGASNAALWQFNEAVSLLGEIVRVGLREDTHVDIERQHPEILEALREFAAALLASPPERQEPT